MPSRLMQPSGALEREPRRVAAHNARLLDGSVLVTNEAGEHAWLSPADYDRYLAGALGEKEPLHAELLKKDFLREGLDFPHLAERFAARRLLDWPGPSVHTVVVTQRCNFKCSYCHASVVGEREPGRDMTADTARRTVDMIFRSPNPSLMIEFQGGEPLLNWPVLKLIVEYARKKNELHKRTLHFGLISNFSLLTDEHVRWAEANGVSFCTSLDGPADLHDKNRAFLGGSGHALAVAGLRRIQERRKAGAKLDAPNAICTVTRFAFGREKEIVDQCVELGIERVQLGPLDPVGFARKAWDSIGYTPREFADFYAKALDRVIERSREGAKVYEKMALIFLLRILEGAHWRFPNADAVARLAYGWDGSIYSCEDARLLAQEGDAFFKLGHVACSTYEELLEHPLVRASLLASAPESQPMCFQCAYNPFCTVMPVQNYETQGGVWGRMPENAWCGKMMGVFDVLFERLRKPETRKVLESWLEHKDR